METFLKECAPSPTALVAELRVENFRCLEHSALRFHPHINVITGDNGAGKTSVLEAIYFLSRGRSFRSAEQRVLVRAGCLEATLWGLIQDRNQNTSLGLRLGRSNLEIHVGGQSGGSVADLATTLPVQAIHAEIASLVQGAPEARRRLLDWGVFHVEPQFLTVWRRYRKAVAQRNAALRNGAEDDILAAWEQEIDDAANVIDEKRETYCGQIRSSFENLAGALLNCRVHLGYQRGWDQQERLAEVLAASRDLDRTVGYTRAGPHRADFPIDIGDLSSRSRASRGQQKLLGMTLILAQTEKVIAHRQGPVALLIDEPAADLDSGRLREVMALACNLGAQLFIASITPDHLMLPPGEAVFHVEHGSAKALL